MRAGLDIQVSLVKTIGQHVIETLKIAEVKVAPCCNRGVNQEQHAREEDFLSHRKVEKNRPTRVNRPDGGCFNNSAPFLFPAAHE